MKEINLRMLKEFANTHMSSIWRGQDRHSGLYAYNAHIFPNEKHVLIIEY